MSRGSREKRARVGGFTLIELLVVVAILALLIAILLPALTRARDNGKTARCLANMHSIGNATASYVAENDGMLFPCYYNQYKNPAGVTVPSKGLDGILSEVVRQTNWNPANQNRAPIYFCPSAITGVTQYPQTLGCNMGAHVRTPIVYNNASYGNIPQVRMSRIARPYETISMTDVSQTSGALTNAGWITGTGVSTQWSAGQGSTVTNPGTGGDGYWNNPTQAGNLLPINNTDTTPSDYHLRYRHNGDSAINIVFLDGHAETAKIRTLVYRNMSTSY
jgi:prepilin-type N-terminal cleavage/methylation domain-containing protein/prepilin-type processing-associated H-X9-DG protein